MDYLDPWFAVNDPSLVDELRRELPLGHILAGIVVAARARRQDRDDVLLKSWTARGGLLGCTSPTRQNPIHAGR